MTNRLKQLTLNENESKRIDGTSCRGTDPDLINRHATRLRLITATLANRMNELITLLGEGHEPEK
jgi:hypothetical protein